MKHNLDRGWKVLLGRHNMKSAHQSTLLQCEHWHLKDEKSKETQVGGHVSQAAAEEYVSSLPRVSNIIRRLNLPMLGIFPQQKSANTTCQGFSSFLSFYIFLPFFLFFCFCFVPHRFNYKISTTTLMTRSKGKNTKKLI